MKKYFIVVLLLASGAAFADSYDHVSGYRDRHGHDHYVEPQPVCQSVEQCAVSVSLCAVSFFNGSVSFQYEFSAREKHAYVCLNKRMQQANFEGYKNVSFETGVNNQRRAALDCQIQRNRYINRVPLCAADPQGDVAQ